MTEPVDRRTFLKYTGVAGAATGVAWVTPSVLGSTSAFAAGSCINHATLDWDSSTARSMPAPSIGGTVSGYASIPASGGSPAIRVNITVTRVGTPGTGSGVYNGVLNQTNGGIPGRQYFVGMANNASNEGYTVQFDFRDSTNTNPVNVYNLAYTVTDIDSAGSTTNGYQDKIVISPTPATGSYTTHSANVTGAGTTTSPFIAASGSGNVDPSNNYGNVDLTFAGPLNSTSVTFLSGNRLNAIQSISISDLTWCY